MARKKTGPKKTIPKKTVPMLFKSHALLGNLMNLTNEQRSAVVVVAYLDGEDPFIYHNIKEFERGFQIEVGCDLLETALEVLDE